MTIMVKVKDENTHLMRYQTSGHSLADNIPYGIIFSASTGGLINVPKRRVQDTGSDEERIPTR